MPGIEGGYAHPSQRTRAPRIAGLEPYAGPWSEAQARHLLRRLTFVSSPENAQSLLAMGMEGAVRFLLTPVDPPPPPVDPYSGTTWVDQPFDNQNESKYVRYLQAWWLHRMLTTPTSAMEKLTLFWHNHFVSEYNTVRDSRYMYRQNALFRTMACGNVKSLVRAVTIDPAMLRYLNGNANTAGKPNENYARELQELFTIGKGAEIAQGNYTNYTEDDVKAAARVLTGWIDNRSTVTSSFVSSRHDTKDKTFSSAYQNTIIRGRSGAEGEQELDELLDMIFRQQETARALVRKIYRWFVYYEITPDIETTIIAPLADLLRSSNNVLLPVLERLFSSAHFYSDLVQGALIQHPVDFIATACSALSLSYPSVSEDAAKNYSVMDRLRITAGSVQMQLLNPPSVAGWSAYYQIPQFHELWINSVTLPLRNGFTDALITGYRIGTVTVQADLIALATSTSDPVDPDLLVRDLSRRLLPFDLTSTQRRYLVDTILMQGLPAYEWGVEWGAYLADPTNTTKKRAVTNKLSAVLRFLLRMAEFQLS